MTSPHFSPGSRVLTNEELWIAPLWTETHSPLGVEGRASETGSSFVSAAIGLLRDTVSSGAQPKGDYES